MTNVEEDNSLVLTNVDLDFDAIPTHVIRESPQVSDEEPDVEDIQDKQITSNNHTTCVSEESDPLTALREVFDEETCTNLIIGYYDAYSKSGLSKPCFYFLISFYHRGNETGSGQDIN